MPRTMRTLAGCLTLDSDSWVLKSFERNTVQVLVGDPLENVGVGVKTTHAQRCGVSCVKISKKHISK